MFQYQSVIQMGQMRSHRVPGTLTLTLLNNDTSPESHITSRDGFIRSHQRLSSVITSKIDVGNAPFISLVWQLKEEHVNRSVASMRIRYIKLSPVAIRKGEQLTRFYCSEDEDSVITLQPFVAIRLAPKFVC